MSATETESKIIKELNAAFDEKIQRNGYTPWARGDIASHVLWRTVGMLSYLEESGTPSERKFAREILNQMIETIKESKP